MASRSSGPSGWRGACNQSINIGASLGGQPNLMSHRHAPFPFVRLPPALRAPPPPALWILFLTSHLLLAWTSVPHQPVTQRPSLASCAGPPPLTSFKFQRERRVTKERNATGFEGGGR